MFTTCNCGHKFSVDGRQPGQFVDCPECRSSCLVRADATEPRGSDVPQMSLDGPSGDQISINPELPPLTFWSSNERIAIDAENGMIAFDNCFVPDTGFWGNPFRSVESYACSLSDVVRAFLYRRRGRRDEGRILMRHTEIVTTAGKAHVCVLDEGDRDERLREICDYLNSEGYVSLEGTPPSHFILWGVILLVAVVMVIASFIP